MAGVPLDLDQLKAPTCAIVQLKTQMPGVVHQVVLRPDKISRAGFIRLGDTPGDEASCWVHADNLLVMELLGEAIRNQDGSWTFTRLVWDGKGLREAA